MGSTAALLISTWASHGEQQDQPLGLGGGGPQQAGREESPCPGRSLLPHWPSTPRSRLSS